HPWPGSLHSHAFPGRTSGHRRSSDRPPRGGFCWASYAFRFGLSRSLSWFRLPGAFRTQREIQGKLAALIELTFYADGPLVSEGNGLYITQPQAEALDIVDIAGMHPVEFIKDMLLILFRNSDTPVADPDLDAAIQI